MQGGKLTSAWQEAAAQLPRLYRHAPEAELKPRWPALWLWRGNHAAGQTAALVGTQYSSLMPGRAW